MESLAPRKTTRPSGLPEIPGYTVLSELGKGGMGIVYKARHLQLQRLVALKMILRERDVSRETLDRFEREAAVVAQFQHPNLVQIYEVSKPGEKPWLALELLEGGSLNRKLAGAPQPAAEAAAMVETLARAVDYAHRKGIVHRDLKPTNILLAADGTPKIADFGLAKQIDQESGHTETGGIVGTPSYMAPEQAWGDNALVGPASDTYALGVILYEMLTGRPPFKAADKWHTIEMVRTAEPVPPRRLSPDTPRDLELICLKCLAKAPAQRFGSAQELADELRRFQEGRPIKTRPTPIWELMWKWTKRQPLAASLIAVALIALIAFGLFLDQRARTAQGELASIARSTKARARFHKLHGMADAAKLTDLLAARGFLHGASEILEAEPDLDDLKPLYSKLQSEINDLQKEADHKFEEAKKHQAAEANYKEFVRHREDAQFYGTVSENVDQKRYLAEARKAVQAALAIYGINDDTAESPSFPEHLAKDRQVQCTVACYELLLIGANVEARLGQKERSARLTTRAGSLREQLPPQEALDHFHAGLALREQGKVKEASDRLVAALWEQPDHFWAKYFLSICDLQLLRPDRARNNLTECIRARPDFMILYVYRGFANGLLDEFDDAERDFSQTLKKLAAADASQKYGALMMQQARYGIHINQAALCLRQVDLAKGPGQDAFRRERLVAAEAYLAKASEVQSDHFASHRYLSLVYQRQKRLDEALEQADLAIEKAASERPAVRAQLFGQRARLKRERNELDGALDDLAKANKLFPSVEDYIEQGRILFVQKNFEEALTAYNNALRLRSTEADVYRLKADALRTLDREAEAVQALDKYKANGGKMSAEILRARGVMRGKLKLYQLALADLTQALELQPEPATYTARAWVLLATGAGQFAWDDFEEAIQLAPKAGEAYTGRALLHARQGRPKQAIADVETALYHGPKTHRLFWNASHVYAQLAAQLAADPAAQTPLGRLARTQHQNKSVEMLEKAVEDLSAAQQIAFWNTYVAADKMLNPVRDTPRFRSLERKIREAQSEQAPKN